MSEKGYLLSKDTAGNLTNLLAEFGVDPLGGAVNNSARRRDILKIESWSVEYQTGFATVYNYDLDDGWFAVSEESDVKVISTRGDLEEGRFYEGLKWGMDSDGVPTYHVIPDGSWWCKVQTKTGDGTYTGCLMLDNGSLVQIGDDDSIEIIGPQGEAFDIDYVYRGWRTGDYESNTYRCVGGGFCTQFVTDWDEDTCEVTMSYTKLPPVYETLEECESGEVYEE